MTRLDHLGVGIAQHKVKVVFIPGVLSGEKAIVQLTEQKERHSRAKLLNLEIYYIDRVEPKYEHYNDCG